MPPTSNHRHPVATALLAAGLAVGEARAEGTIVVEGAADPRPSATPGAMSVIPVDGRLGADADVASAVDRAPGTTLLELGGIGDFAAVSLRGSSLRQVLVAIDGVPLNPDGAGAVDLSELPLRAFRELRVSRGAAPAALGGAPIGGVVDLITRGGDGVEAGILGGSWTTGRLDAAARGEGAVGTVPVDGLVLLDVLGTQGNYPAYNDGGTPYFGLDDHDAPRQNNRSGQLALHTRARLGPADRRVGLTASLFGRDEGLPGHANNPASAAALATRRGLVALSGERAQGDWSGQLTAFGLVRTERLSDPDRELGIGLGSVAMTSDMLGLGGHAAFAPSARVTGTLGVSGRRDGYRDDRDAAQSRFNGAAMLAVDWRGAKDAWHLAPAVQVGGIAGGLGWVAPRLGGALRVGKALVLRAQGGRGVRIPDFTELYGDRGAQKGNPDLRPERGWSVDGGARVAGTLAGARLTADVGAFFTDTVDMVVWVQNAQRVLVPLNLAAARTAGVEAEGRAVLGPLDVSGSLTWTATENRGPDPATTGRRLPRIPTWEASIDATATAGPARLGAGFRHVDGQYWDATNRYRAPPRTFVDARLGFDLGHGLVVELDVRNLLDRRVEVVPRDPLDPDGVRVLQPVTDFVGWPLPGRTFLLAVRYAPGST